MKIVWRHGPDGFSVNEKEHVIYILEFKIVSETSPHTVWRGVLDKTLFPSTPLIRFPTCFFWDCDGFDLNHFWLPRRF